MAETYSRPCLPTSSSDFALPPSSSNSPVPADDVSNPLLFRFRRPSLLAPKATYFSESRLSSPLTTSFSVPLHRRGQQSGEESESERERMWTDSSPGSSSENPTPPLGPPIRPEPRRHRSSSRSMRKRRSPSGSPRAKSPFNKMDTSDLPLRIHNRRPSHPLKLHRILTILAQESRPEESELKSEAAFQRLVTSGTDLPSQPRTPRAPSDRGRYPEEAGQEESQREDTPSDDGDDADSTFSFFPPSSSFNVGSTKPVTPAGSVNGDDMFVTESPGGIAMDVDMPSPCPSLSSTPAPSQWRYTPPPTTSAVRSNKRKLDDRYDPYPTSSKRRAVSPSLSFLRESHPSLVSPILSARNLVGTSRHSIPIAIPQSSSSSTMSSPTIGSYPGPSISRPVSIGSPSIMSSPTMRSTMGLASPIIWPLPRAGVRRGEEEEREVEGAGEAVGGLRLI